MKKLIVPNPHFKERIEKMLVHQHFMHLMDFNIYRIEPGLIEGSLSAELKHQQQFGILHGGVVSAIADTVAGFSVYTLAPEDQDVVTAEIKISYFRAGLSPVVKAIGRVVKPGRLFAYAEAEVYGVEKEESILLAKATTTMAFIPRKYHFEQ